MITRLVEMEIKPEAVQEFLGLYRSVRREIQSQPGCMQVLLVQAIDRPNQFATWSSWEDEAGLEAYRRSSFFRGFWPSVRALFSSPARAQTWRPLEEDE
ncbi:MAG: hypothetical protein NVS2B7_09880 [Herpetosiphon sp.]